MTNNKKLFTAKEASEILRLHPKSLYRLIKMGKIQGYKVAGKILIDVDSVLEQSKIKPYNT